MQADSAQQQGLIAPNSTTMHAASAHLPISTASAITRFWTTRCPFWSTWSTAAAPGSRRTPATAPGILFQVPHHFFRKEAQKCGQILPAEGDYGVAMLFFPQDDKGIEDARRVFEEGCAEAGVPLLFWREVPSTRMTWARRPAPACPPSCRPSWAAPTTRPPVTPSSAACTCAAAPSRRRPTLSSPCAIRSSTCAP